MSLLCRLILHLWAWQVVDVRVTAVRPTLDELRDRIVHAIVHHFHNPRFGLCNEALAHDYTCPSDANEDFCYLGTHCTNFV